MLVLKRFRVGKTDGFRIQVKTSIIERRNLYCFEGTFKLEKLAEESIVSLRNAYFDTPTATIRLPLEAAQKLLIAGKVRIRLV